MRKGFEQYPDAYSKERSRYRYYTDSREMIVLIAGENGVTEKWIEILRQMHREEINMLRRGRSKGAGKNRLLSLEIFENELQDKTVILMDKISDIESDYIERLEREERNEALKRALKKLEPNQRRILFEIRVKRRTLTEVAQELGITRQSLAERLQRIEKKCKENVEPAPAKVRTGRRDMRKGRRAKYRRKAYKEEKEDAVQAERRADKGGTCRTEPEWLA